VRRALAAIAGQFNEHDLLTYSSAIAFQVLYAVVPLTLLGLAGLALVGQSNLYTDHIAPTLQQRLSSDASHIANRTAARVLGREHLWWATLGLGVTLWGVGASLRAMMTPLNAIYDARETRSWLRRLLVSLGGGLLVTVCIFTAAAVVLGGRLVHPHGFVSPAFFLLRWLIAFAVLLVTIGILIRLVPAKKRPVGWITLGSVLAALCWVVATVGFGLYISTVSYASFYGGLGSIIVLLIYLHTSAIAFLLGVIVDSLLRDHITKSRRRR
jgi:membrane protein